MGELGGVSVFAGSDAGVLLAWLGDKGRLMEHGHVRSLVDAKGYEWGHQWRRNFGANVSISLPSVLGRANESPSHDRNYPEVFKDGAIDFAMALKKLPERHRQMALIHYVIPVPAKVKAAEMGIHVQTYWYRLNRLRAAVAGALDL